jgi:hypothetical protein
MNQQQLKQGMKILLPQSGPAVVLFTTETRARVRLLAKKNCDFKTFDGKRVKFEAPGKEMDISLNSEVEVLQ